MLDPIIEEVRRIRDENAKRFGYDAFALGRYFMSQEKKAGHPIHSRKKTKSRSKSPKRRRVVNSDA
jgi:hypothetical protein